jgi:hypothetical protein
MLLDLNHQRYAAEVAQWNSEDTILISARCLAGKHRGL